MNIFSNNKLWCCFVVKICKVMNKNIRFLTSHQYFLINLFSSTSFLVLYKKHVQALQCLKRENDLISFILVDYCRICYRMIQSKKIIWQSKCSHGHCCMMFTFFIFLLFSTDANVLRCIICLMSIFQSDDFAI